MATIILFGYILNELDPPIIVWVLFGIGTLIKLNELHEKIKE